MARTKEKTIVAIGPLPPPYNGQSVSFRMLVDELEQREKVIPIDIMIADNPDQSRLAGVLTRALSLFRLVSSLVPIFYRYDCRVYLTISQSVRGFPRDYMIIMLAHWFRHPIVAHLKGGNYDGFYYKQRPLIQKMIRQMLRRVETLVVLGKRLIPMYNFDPDLEDKVVVVENGLPFDKEPSKGKTLPNDEVRVLFLSNLIESKGYLDLLNAVALCKNHEPRIHVHFAGNFQDSADDIIVRSGTHAREIFDQKIKDLGIEDRTTYHGLVIDQEKKDLLENCHMLALPTRYIYEGQPVSIIEALAFGMPIIATDYRAITDMVIDGKTGVLVQPTEAKNIAEAILYISDPSRYQEMSLACLDLFNAKFTRLAHLGRLMPHLSHNTSD
jgi:glycosyltransferase involved in cell wall biosynthesis